MVTLSPLSAVTRSRCCSSSRWADSDSVGPELAHAYTRVGADADGRRWGTTTFQRTDRALWAGLAQYYACRVLERLGKLAPGTMDAYEKLLPYQPAVYRSHLGWLVHHSPAEVRDAMQTICCQSAGSLAEFETLLGEARRRNR